MRRCFSIHNVLKICLRTTLAAALICLAALVVSCKTVKTVEVPVYIHDTAYVAHNVHDSILVENTIKEYIKGDTVFFEKWHTKYKERIVYDTVYTEKEVPVTVKEETVEYVEKELNWFQKTMMILGGCFILSIIGFIAYIIIKIRAKIPI